MVVNVVDKFVPTEVTAVIITTAMRAAIKPYSMAVTPESFFKKFFRIVILSSIHKVLFVFIYNYFFIMFNNAVYS